MPAGKKFAKGGFFVQACRTQRIVGDGVPVDASGAEAQNAEAAAVAVRFGKVAVVLEAEMAGFVLRMDAGHPAPDAVRTIGEFALEAEGLANRRVNAVASDDEIRFDGESIFKVKQNRVGALLEARKRMSHVDGAGRHGLSEGGLELRAMDGDAGAIVDGEWESFDAFAVRVFHEHATERAAAGHDSGKNVRVNLIEGPDGVGPEAYAGADFLQFRGAFIDVYFETNFAEGDGGGESTDAAADDCRTFHDCPPEKRIRLEENGVVMEKSYGSKQIVLGNCGQAVRVIAPGKDRGRRW